jgi:hypothetical protein
MWHSIIRVFLKIVRSGSCATGRGLPIRMIQSPGMCSAQQYWKGRGGNWFAVGLPSSFAIRKGIYANTLRKPHGLPTAIQIPKRFPSFRHPEDQ